MMRRGRRSGGRGWSRWRDHVVALRRRLRLILLRVPIVVVQPMVQVGEVRVGRLERGLRAERREEVEQLRGSRTGTEHVR